MQINGINLGFILQMLTSSVKVILSAVAVWFFLAKIIAFLNIFVAVLFFPPSFMHTFFLFISSQGNSSHIVLCFVNKFHFKGQWSCMENSHQPIVTFGQMFLNRPSWLHRDQEWLITADQTGIFAITARITDRNGFERGDLAFLTF